MMKLSSGPSSVSVISAFLLLIAVTMPAPVSLAVMTAATVAFAVVIPVMTALDVRVILKRSRRQRLSRAVSRTGHAAVEFDPGFHQCISRSHADTAANQRIDLRGFQKTGQRAVAAAIGVYDLFGDNFAFFHVIKLELPGVTEMLEDLSVFIGYCPFLSG